MRATGHAEAADLTAEHERAAHVAGDARVPCRPGCGRLLGRELVHEAAERKAVAKPQAVDVEAERHGAEAGLSAVAVDALLDAVERRQRTAHTLDLPYPVEISHDQVVARRSIGQTRRPTSAPLPRPSQDLAIRSSMVRRCRSSAVRPGPSSSAYWSAWGCLRSSPRKSTSRRHGAAFRVEA